MRNLSLGVEAISSSSVPMSTSQPLLISHFFTYYPLFLTCITTVLNIFMLIVFQQKVFHQRPTIRYMRAMAVVDALMLYGWNLDHFFLLKFGFEMDKLTIVSCKLANYFNHVFTQSSAWLRVWMCVDRFCILRQVCHRQAVYQHRRVLILIILTFFAIALINLHLPIFACFVDRNGTKISSGSQYYRLYPTWNYITFAMYNVLPFLLMLIFNIFIIRHLMYLKRTSTLRQSRVPHSSISISILLSTFLFCLMTTSPAVIFTFCHTFSRSNFFRRFLLNILDSVKYTYHSLSFVLYFITLVEFRLECFRLLKCSSCFFERIFRWIRPNSSRAEIYLSPSTPIATIEHS